MSGTITAVIGALFSPQRSIGTLIPDAVVEELATDTLEITQHPVEKGAAVADHAFDRPAEVRITAVWSNASLSGAALSESYATRQYEALLALKSSAEPFTLVTGKRRYENMLIASIFQTTDSRTEYALSAQILCRQVFITSSQIASVRGNGGVKQPVQVTDSATASAVAGSM